MIYIKCYRDTGMYFVENEKGHTLIGKHYTTVFKASIHELSQYLEQEEYTFSEGRNVWNPPSHKIDIVCTLESIENFNKEQFIIDYPELFI
jgi:hypothetical protein